MVDKLGIHTIEICVLNAGDSGFTEKLLRPVVDELSIDAGHD